MLAQAVVVAAREASPRHVGHRLDHRQTQRDRVYTWDGCEITDEGRQARIRLAAEYEQRVAEAGRPHLGRGASAHEVEDQGEMEPVERQRRVTPEPGRPPPRRTGGRRPRR